MNKIVSWFTGNHVAANLLMAFIMLGGIITGLFIKVEIFPEISLDTISITVEYEGATPEEVEEGVVRPIEEAISGLAGIKRVDSLSREGFGSITVEVMKGWNAKKLLDDIKSEVDRITTLPDEAEKPIVREDTRRTHVISLALYGDAPESTLKSLAQRIKDDITNLPHITLAEMWGTRDNEIHVEISEENLRKYNLTLDKVAQIIRSSSFDLPAGRIKTKAGEILLRTRGRRYYARDFADISIITKPDGSRITLADIATLRDGFQDVDIVSRFMGKPCVIINVYRVADQNALKVAEEVKKYIEKVRDTLPAGVSIDIYRDRSQILKSRLNLLLKNMAYGLVLVSILLGIFLNRRLAFWVTLGIPISFLGGLFMLPRFDVSINMVSLFAFIAVLGIVVDDAIVIGENIFRKYEEGIPPENAVVDGTVEVGRPVIFAVLTTVAAFYPLLLGSGMMGKFMRNIPLVVNLVLMVSLVEAILILPAHIHGSLGKLNSKKGVVRAEPPYIGKLLKRFISGPYRRVLDFCIRWRYAVISLGIALLVITFGVWKGGWIKFTFFPKIEGDTLIANLTMPPGTPLERTEEVVRHIEESAKRALKKADKERPPGSPPLLKYYASVIGFQGGRGPHAGPLEIGGHLAQIYVRLLEGEKRNISAVRLASLWRKEVGVVPDAEALTFQSTLFSVGNPIEVHLSMEDYHMLKHVADELKGILAQIPGVFDIEDSFLPGKREIQLKLKPEARTLGITLNDLARQVRHAFYGAEALRFQRDRDEVKVMVRYPDDERKSISSIDKMRIRTPSGHEVPFSQVAEVKLKRGYTTIQRAQRMRVIKVMADVDETISNAKEIRDELKKRILPGLMSKYQGLRYSIEGEGKEEAESMADVYQGFIIALFAIYVLIAIPFKSYFQPFIVMSAIPFGFMGAIAGHIIMGKHLSIVSLFGMVGLAGVAVNDSLVLIDACNSMVREGIKPIDAIKRAGERRFRAIILTSLTTFAGLTPMILERSIQAQFLIPMAISLGFGVLFTTLITLLLVPCLFMVWEDIKRIFIRR